jgi:methanogenic corrinoid protein MtbC1/DNA-binding XRE family transcriptional regulator
MPSNSDLYQTLREKFYAASVSGDRPASKLVLESAVEKTGSVLDAYVQVIVPVLERVGAEWAKGSLSIAKEHLATQVTLEQMILLREQIRPKPSIGKNALITTLPGDLHVVGARMIADFFYADGWNVEFLGTETPVDEIVSFVREKGIDAVLVSVSSAKSLPQLKTLSGRIAALTDPPVLVAGGLATRTHEADPALQTVDLLSNNPYEAVDEVRRLCGVPVGNLSIEELLSHLGSNIQRIRNEKRISQKALSSASDLDRAYLSSIENGKKNLTISALLRLADALEIDIKELF